jgi:transposase
MELIPREPTLSMAAAKAGMDEKTARKYRKLGQLPGDVQALHTWRTRPDPFAEVWDEMALLLRVNPELQAKTLFEDLQRRYPGRFCDGQLRTLQRHVKVWRATEGPPREVFFPQVHHPGDLSQSDFTCLNDLGVTIAGLPFDHLVYHFVLTYSNWEAARICFSESFESLSEGLQQALWELGGAPRAHQTDRLSSAVQDVRRQEVFTKPYRALLDHYGIEARATQAASPHENGDVEQRHHRFKQAIDQALMLRGSRAFDSRKAYEGFLQDLVVQLNAGRKDRLDEELGLLRPLPARRIETSKRLRVKVGPSSTIRVVHNVYSVDSRLIGEAVDVHVRAEHIEVWYGSRCLERMPRLRGECRHLIQYRHIIDWLVRKPGAFENYRYRVDMFPTSRFRMAYDSLRGRHTLKRADREYLRILYLAARQGQTRVEGALEHLLSRDSSLSAQAVEAFLAQKQTVPPIPDIAIAPVDLTCYDALLCGQEEVAG